MPRLFISLPAVTLLAALVAGCMADGATTAPSTGRTFGVTTTVAEPVDFVRRSRTGTEEDFIPVGVTPPPRGVQRRDATGVQKLESDLKAQRDRSNSFARRPAPKSSYDGRVPPRVRPPAPSADD
jgi:hypothetical protein